MILHGTRKGYTLLEIMISVTLMLMLMYGVAAIFSRVGGIMNETQSTMEMSNALRNTRLRLESDLKAVSVPLVPPRNSNSNEGYFCYIEGLGLPYTQLNGYDQLQNCVVTDTTDTANFSRFAPVYKWQKGSLLNTVAGFTEPVIPWDNDINKYDTSISDGDDILMFTAKAPINQMFRGRFGNEIIQSENAEIVWFLRGTTLYRRVLLIVPDAVLQDKMQEMIKAFNLDTTKGHTAEVQRGYGFLRFYDVSVHLNENGNIVANTLGDLANRANRYGYWQSMVNKSLSNDKKTLGQDQTWSPFGIGNNNIKNAWYYLRLPTLQESAVLRKANNSYFDYSFRAGVPFGKNYMNSNTDDDLAEWFGAHQQVNYQGFPKIDFWNDPNCWGQVNNLSGDLQKSLDIDGLFAQDTILTNVISFDVKGWDETLNKFVDLGAYPGGVKQNNGTILIDNSDKLSCLASFGNYGIISTEKPFMPAVYDTWTQQYEVDYLNKIANCINESPINRESAANKINNIPVNGPVASSLLQNYPPPYETPLKSLQINIRVFDPRSRNIRNMSLQVNFNTGDKN